MHHHTRTLALGASGLLMLSCSSVSIAQEAMETAAATLPSPGAFTFRPQLHYSEYGANPNVPGEERTRKLEAMASLSYGIVRNWSVQFDVPVVHEWKDTTSGDSSGFGVEDLHIEVKHRFYKNDPGPIDTRMAAVFFGAAFASGDSREFSSGSVNPHLGAVYSIVHGRWGFNQELTFTWNTGGDERFNLGNDGPADSVKFNTAGVYRIWPERFETATVGAWYITAEALGLYETTGDVEVRFAPGVMYEGRTVSFEAMLQLPMIESVDSRPNFEWGVGVGIRVSF